VPAAMNVTAIRLSGMPKVYPITVIFSKRKILDLLILKLNISFNGRGLFYAQINILKYENIFLI
jgi:hypothetical protein